jgi:hypothetical protein
MLLDQDADLLGKPAADVARDVLEQLPKGSLGCLNPIV